ncbi:unnamed protein product [Chrysoparadoxa australica]
MLQEIATGVHDGVFAGEKAVARGADAAIGVISRLPLMPLWVTGRVYFAITLLFFGAQFDTFAFHLILFRLTGYRQVEASFKAMIAKCKQARAAVKDAYDEASRAKELLATDKEVNKALEKDVQVALNQGVIRMRKVQELADLHRESIHSLLEQKKKAQYAALGLGTLIGFSLMDNARAIYSSLALAIAGSTITLAGIVTLVKTCADLLEKDFERLMGPLFDDKVADAPLDEVESYVVSAFSGSIKTASKVAWILMPVMLYTIQTKSTKAALLFSLCFYAGSVLEMYIIRGINRWTPLKVYKDGRFAAILHLSLAAMGMLLHDYHHAEGHIDGECHGWLGPLPAICEPLIGVLKKVSIYIDGSAGQISWHDSQGTMSIQTAVRALLGK